METEPLKYGNAKAIFITLDFYRTTIKKNKKAEVWYKIYSNYWNKGYASECLKKVIEFAFKTLKLHRIEAGCAVDNIASVKVLENCGMIKEGRGRQVLPLKSGWSDNFEYSILETDKKIR